MSDLDDLARAMLPSWPPRDAQAIYSTVPDREPKAWAAQFGTDFVGAWDACPEPEWLIVFALVVASGCGEATKARVAEAVTRAANSQDVIPPSNVTPATIRLFRVTWMPPRSSADVLQELRSSLEGRAMLRESMLVP